MAFLTRGFIPTPWRLDRDKNRPAFIWNIHPSGPKTSTNCFRAFFCPKGKHKPGAEERSPYRFHQYTSVSFHPAAGGGPRTPAVSSAPHPRTRGRCGSPAGLHPLIPVTSMRLPLPVLTVMAVSRGNLPETVGPRRWVHCVLF